MAALKNMPWIWFYTVFVAVWTYWCTRGRDGHLMATIVGFSVFGILYGFTIYWHRPITASTKLWHLVIFEVAVTIALLVNPQLDEMGGMLNLLIPSIVLAIVLGGLILSLFFQYFGVKD